LLKQVNLAHGKEKLKPPPHCGFSSDYLSRSRAQLQIGTFSVKIDDCVWLLRGINENSARENVFLENTIN
jgi:hypothetical protein